MSVNSVTFFLLCRFHMQCFYTIIFFVPMPKTLKTFMDSDHSFGTCSLIECT